MRGTRHVFATVIWAAALFSLISCSSLTGDSNGTGPGQTDTPAAEAVLVYHLPFNEGEGTTAHDATGNGPDAVVSGAEWTAGPRGGALEFDGTDDFVAVEAPPSLADLGQGSISVWFRADHIPQNFGMRPIFYYGKDGVCPKTFDASNAGLIIELGHSPIHPGSDWLYFTIFANGCTYPSFCYDSRRDVTLDEWHHFVAVVGPDYNTGYFDGEEMTSRWYNFGNASYSQFLEDAVEHEALWIGRGYWDEEPMYFDGAIDDVRVYSGPLSAREVAELYDGTVRRPGHRD
ncbi:MAG: hypothetical protein GF405_09945 [Candidatus Eisenbacteria bacterium]|nr:hypothetical protein [Candidatus Eisenbacteria bacterium]